MARDPMADKRAEWLKRSRDAHAMAAEHVSGAEILAKSGYLPQAFGLLIYSAEETTKCAIYLYAHVGLVTFDRARAGEVRYFCEDWLYDHPRKQSEFARQQVRDLMAGASIWMLLGVAGGADEETVASLLLTFGVIGLTLQAWSERFEEMRELAFHSGPSPRGKGDVMRPGQPQFDALKPLVEDRVNELGTHLASTPNREKIETTDHLPDRETWATLVSHNPRDTNLWETLFGWWSQVDVEGLNQGPPSP